MYAAARLRTEWIALALGAAVATFAVAGWQVEGGTRVPAAKVELVTAPTGELDVVPGGVSTETAALRASERVALVRALDVRNATAAGRDVHFGATPAHGELNPVLHVSIHADGGRVFAGTLETLRHGSQAFRLPSGQTSAVRVRVWIPADAPAETWRARSLSIRLDLTSVEAR